MFKKCLKNTKTNINNKICIIKRDHYEYPISLQLIKDGRNNNFFNKKFKYKIPVTMVHGKKDEAVPINFSKKTLKIFTQASKKLKIVIHGDHSLSSKRNLRILLVELNLILKNI